MKKIIPAVDSEGLRGKITISTDGSSTGAYFSVTAWFGGENTGWGGACHEEILKIRPDLAPIVALHLSDLNGVPMYAVENGWYWIAGACGGLGEEYHGANDGRHTAMDCETIAANHFRIDFAQVRGLMEQAKMEGKKAVEIFCAARRTIWKMEAKKALDFIAGL